MAAIDFSQPLLAAGASARTDFAAAQARTGLDFVGAAVFKRGIKAQLGIGAFANASASLSKFIAASIEGKAFARAQAGIQLQLPLNLFEEFGLSVRAEAIAEAAAGVEGAFGVTIGDFVLLAKRDPNLVGLPLEILLLFLEEVIIGGAFEVNVSASAKAHASISISGSIIERAGEKAGFFYTIDAGAGLAAGVGMGFKAGLEFRDFRRFYGRAVDKAVDHSIAGIMSVIPAELLTQADRSPIAPVFAALGPLAKIALRVAYDLGVKITENNPGRTANDKAILCDEAVKIILQESQRFIFVKILESGLQSINEYLQGAVPGLPAGLWESSPVMTRRQKLADHLLSMPAEPFLNTADQLLFWSSLVTLSLELLNSIGNPEPELSDAVGVVYCTSELLLEAVRSKVNTATAYASAVGVGAVSSGQPAFDRVLDVQPSPDIVSLIRAKVGGSGPVSYSDLIDFILADTFVNRALAHFPELSVFIRVFAVEFMRNDDEVIRLFLNNGNSFDPSGSSSGSSDPVSLLDLLVTGLDKYVELKLKNEVLPLVLDNVSDSMQRLYIEEVLLASVVYIKDVGLKTVLDWDKQPADNDSFTEGLASVITLLLGRTLVILGDTFLAASQEEFGKTCNELAADLRRYRADPNGASAGVRNLLTNLDPRLVDLVSDCVEVGGEVLGPLPDDTRKSLRDILYQVFEPIPPGRETDFLERLQDDFFVPRLDELRRLADKLVLISKERFALFVEMFLAKVGEYAFEVMEDLITEFIKMVLAWEKYIVDSIREISRILRRLDTEIERLNRRIVALMVEVLESINRLFETLRTSDIRNSILSDIKARFITPVFSALEGNPLYRALPSELRVKSRNAVNSIVSSAVVNNFTEVIFDTLYSLDDFSETILSDMRKLDPNEDLPDQLMQLVFDRIEDSVSGLFGGVRPAITPVIMIDYYEYVVESVIPPRGRWKKRELQIPLGRVEIRLDAFISVVRNTIKRLNGYRSSLEDTCFKFGELLAKELELLAMKLERDKQLGRKNSLERIDMDHNREPKSVSVLSPLQFDHFTNGFDIKVQLSGVPLSYLGSGQDELQRVLVFLNGELVPMERFRIEDIERQPSHRPKDGVGFGFGDLKYERKVLTTRKGPLKGKAVYRYSSRMMSDVGHMFRPTRLSDGGGIIVSLNLNIDDAVVMHGVNVLAVIIFEKGGDRYEHSVTFTVEKLVDKDKGSSVRSVSTDVAGGRIGRPPVSMNDLTAYFLENRDRLPIHSREVFARNKKGQSAAKLIKVLPEVHADAGGPPMLKREVVKVLKKNKAGVISGKGRELTIEYSSAAERRARLAKLKLDNITLAGKGQVLWTTSVDYIQQRYEGSYGNREDKANTLDVSRAVVKGMPSEWEERVAKAAALLREYFQVTFKSTNGVK